jgi:hypothetical protein
MIPPATAAVDELATRLAGIEARIHLRHLIEDRQVLLFIIRPSFRPSPGLVRDVSVGGVGFLSDRALEPASVLAIQFRTREEGNTFIRVAEVVHSSPHEQVENAPWAKKKSLSERLFGLFRRQPVSTEPSGIHVIGCRFRTPLTREELNLLS